VGVDVDVAVVIVVDVEQILAEVEETITTINIQKIIIKVVVKIVKIMQQKQHLAVQTMITIAVVKRKCLHWKKQELE
jgi:hypothetical protein